MAHKFDFKLSEDREEQPTRSKLGFGPCEVYGCPRAGHIRTGMLNCRYHHGKSGASLAQITMVLKNHAKEFDWYEHMLNVTHVDFLVGDVARKAPGGLEVLPNENFQAYRARINQHTEDLLMPKSRLLEVAP